MKERKDHPKRVALILGGTQFADPEFNPLPGAEPDCRAMERLMRQAGYKVYSLVGAGRCRADKAERFIKALPRFLSAGHTLVVYAAIHGFELSGMQLLVLPGARWRDIKNLQTKDALSVPWLEEETAVPGLRRLFVFDACRTNLLRGRGVPVGAEEVVFTRSAPRDLVGLANAAREDDPDESPIAFLNACGREGRAREMDQNGRGLFSHAFELEAQEDLRAGRGLLVNWELLKRVQARMGRIWNEAGNPGLLPQKPKLDGDPVLLVEGQSEGDAPRVEAVFARVKSKSVERAKARRQRFDELRQGYLRFAEDPHVSREELSEVWRALCRDVGVENPTTWPHDLVWDEAGPKVVLRMGTPGRGVVYENSLGMRFVPVPVCKDGTSKILASIWLTRRQDYEGYASTNQGVDGTWRDLVHLDKTVQFGPTHPVVAVSWDDAMAFAAWLTRRDRGEGRLPPDARFRLPTDAEWSWMVGVGEVEEQHGPTRSPSDKHNTVHAGTHPFSYPWGPNWPPPVGTGNFSCFRDFDFPDAGRAPEPMGFAATVPVGQFHQNRFGLYDLAGNTWEWTNEPSESGLEDRVLRGGPATFGPSCLLSSYRHYEEPHDRSANIGFRLV